MDGIMLATAAKAGVPHLPPLPALLVESAVRAALLEDLGRAGDITTDGIVPADVRLEAVLAARQPGVVAGLDLAAMAFRLLDDRVRLDVERVDGARLAAGDVVARVSGPARAVLTGERVALNFLCRLSGIATATAALVDAVAGTAARITCTRKTTPGLRAFEKYAVRAGGGANHRFGLDDAVLIKDNHIAVAGGVAEAVARVRRNLGHLVKVEVEVDTLAQLAELLPLEVDAVLLDNMAPPVLREAVAMVADRPGRGRMVTEASGRITVASAPAISATGVDLISAGWLTHSAPILDLGLDFRA